MERPAGRGVFWRFHVSCRCGFCGKTGSSVGCTKEREMGTLATYVVVELDVGILNESEEVGKLFVCFSSCQSFCAEA
jgi:hypothetical protein